MAEEMDKKAAKKAEKARKKAEKKKAAKNMETDLEKYRRRGRQFFKTGSCSGNIGHHYCMAGNTGTAD